MKKELNLDIADAITEFEEYMKSIQLEKFMYKLIFRGKGLEFEGFRKYTQDDDSSNIDWKASVKANQLLVKQYIEERDLKIMFLIDVSDGMLFGSTEKLKCEYSAELTAALAHFMLGYGDNIGYVFFSDKIGPQDMPKKGRKHFDTLIGELSNVENYGGAPDLKNKLKFFLEFLTPTIDTVFIISDFINIDESSKSHLSFLGSKFETMAIMIKDPLDKKMPKVKGEIVIEDPNSQKQLIIDPSIVRKTYERNAKEHEDMVKRMLRDATIEYLDLTTDKDFAPNLAEFLKQRVEKRKYVIPR
jgi:uncharacterized protein (DUF58 family)